MSKTILVFSKYGRRGASSRVRTLQYIPYIEELGWHVTCQPLLSDRYLRSKYSTSRISSILSATLLAVGYVRRLVKLASALRYDVIWIEKELYPYFPATFERLLSIIGAKVVVDYDDAIFHLYDQHRSRIVRYLLGRKIDVVMRSATCVMVGNQYLKEHAFYAGAVDVQIIPTVVDLESWVPRVKSTELSPVVIGWIGTPLTSRYLLDIIPSIKRVLDGGGVKFVCVGGSKRVSDYLDVEIREWSEETEVSDIQSFDIGVMPVPDGPWERGKCGYKIIQYMACGVPAVASPVGVNVDIVEDGVCGFLAENIIEWDRRLLELVNSSRLRKEMGSAGRERVEHSYSVQAQLAKLNRVLVTVSMSG